MSGIFDIIIKENEQLRTQLNLSEKNFKMCESSLQYLQKVNNKLEKENEQLKLELRKCKSEKFTNVSKIGKAGDKKNGSIKNFDGTNSQKNVSEAEERKRLEIILAELKKQKSTLEKKVESLEEELKTVKENKFKYELQLKAMTQKFQLSKSYANDLRATLEKKVESLEEELKSVKENKFNCEFQLKAMTQKFQLSKSYENDLRAIKKRLALNKQETEKLKKDFRNLESKTIEMNHLRKVLYENIQDVCQFLMTNEQIKCSKRYELIFKAAASHTFQALMKLDDAYRRSPLEEMTLQINVYWNEVSRIRKLLAHKELFEEQLDHYIKQ